MYHCCILFTISVRSLRRICASSFILHGSVRLCVFSACWLTPGTLCSCQCPALTPRGLRAFLLGYADKLMLPDWLTAPSVAGTTAAYCEYQEMATGASLCLFVSARANKQIRDQGANPFFSWASFEEKPPNPA